MNCEQWLKEKLDCSEDLAATKIVPAEHVTRQEWQLTAEGCIEQLRKLTDRKAFGLSEAEISVHYHQTLDTFIELLQLRLGLPPKRGDLF